MPNQSQRTRFEQELARLKQALNSGEISIDAYIEQAGRLRFDDTATDQIWWLDPESETWYVAPIGSEDFEPYGPIGEAYSPEPEVLPVNSPSQTESSPFEPEPEFVAPEPEFDSPPSPESAESFSFEPEIEPISSESETPPLPPPTSPESPLVEHGPIVSHKSEKRPKIVLIGAVGIIVIIMLCVGIWLFFSDKGEIPPTPTNVVIQPSSTLTTPPQPTDSPSPTLTIPPQLTDSPAHSQTPTLIPTLAPVPLVSTDTATPSPTPLPSAANSPTPPAIDTATPVILTDTPTAVAIIPTPPTATPEPSLSGKIAYPEYDEVNETFNIIIADAATREVITTIAQASQPALSLDGTKIAYISWNPNLIGLYSLSLLDDKTRNTISTDGHSYRPQWAGDGQAKAFEFIKDEQKENEQKEIRFSDGEGVPGLGKGQTPAWTPNGRMVVQTCPTADCGLAVVNTNGTGFSFLTRNTTDISPAVSPDGQWVAYTSMQTGNGDIWLISINGGQPKSLTDSPDREGIPTWSPDGQWIAFVTESAGKWSVQVISLGGTSRQKLFDISGSLDTDVKVKQEGYRQLGWLHESISWSR